jgi:predicted transposase/invertase (TIGR01784 family)
MSEDERIKEMAWQREIALHDDASKTKGAERRGKAEVARNAINMGLDIETIAKLTGLTREEIEKLR